MPIKRYARPLVVTTYGRLWADDEADALIRELHDIIESDRYQLSPRILTLKAILAKLRPEPVREDLPPPKHLRAATFRPRNAAARVKGASSLNFVDPAHVGGPSHQLFACQRPDEGDVRVAGDNGRSDWQDSSLKHRNEGFPASLFARAGLR
jgi:hypothetical protein